MATTNDLMGSVRGADAVVIVTNHTTYDYPAILEQSKFVFDTRNAVGRLGQTHPNVVTL
jgi:UDP-N-acetyl-D-glucosamine dehydrogenase